MRNAAKLYSRKLCTCCVIWRYNWPGPWSMILWEHAQSLHTVEPNCARKTSIICFLNRAPLSLFVSWRRRQWFHSIFSCAVVRHAVWKYDIKEVKLFSFSLSRNKSLTDFQHDMKGGWCTVPCLFQAKLLAKLHPDVLHLRWAQGACRHTKKKKEHKMH